MKKATFAAGCFWGIELKFSQMEGVTATAVGYMGGTTDQPSYEQVCRGDTYHAEVVQVEYDEQLIDYEVLLNQFWSMHDPTTLNRQGPDVGTQYRSAVFYHDELQHQLAEASKAVLEKNGVFANPIVTQIIPAATFWPAEEYHQKYLQKRGMGSCGI
ncbi:peptide-methionine (S)-S-oxide reductase MsrA [Neptuniibacter halophilus]|uniref:peptide-methionine (S)-S-oxide reductase MsrA n=1 Tax=Neptuniibacter halophilus TaxID=651666 RepID=UPI0025741E3D|nr:peptide-methionine (S)-S-oxide reductase MsrA [Neptuniibacter halophilus]